MPPASRRARTPSNRTPSSRTPSSRGARPARSPRSRPAAAPAPKPDALEAALAAALAVPDPAPVSFTKLGLPSPLVTTLARRGIEAPFAIQARALPDAIDGRDVLGRAATGSGKTLAFGLPMLARLATFDESARPRAPHGLVLAPTRELARQVADALAPLAQALALRVTAVYGGAPMGRQIEALRRGSDVVVATPGRLEDLIRQGACTLDRIAVTVIDEADHMADLGFLPPVTRILEATPDGGQRLLFSATLDRGVGRLVRTFLTDPAVHAVATPTAAAATMDHQLLVVNAEDRVAVTAEIAGRPARTLVFVRTKHGADRLAKQLGRVGVAAGVIHGNRNQSQRQRALDAFTAGHPRVLVATDVAARGIHIDDVDLVVHFDPPADHKDYLHRSGRTARAGARGTVVALADTGQVRTLVRLHRDAGVTATRHDVAPGDPSVRELATSGRPVPAQVAVTHPRRENRRRTRPARRQAA